MRLAALVPGAGLGLRLGPGAPKALRTLGGQTLLLRAVTALALDARVAQVVVAVPADAVSEVSSALAGCVPVPLTVISGGVLRQDSVAGLLSELDPEVTHVLVHDAARPLVPGGVVAAVVDALEGGEPAVIPVLPVVDTIKRVQSSSEGRDLVVDTVDRSELRAVQTPQGFQRDLLLRALAALPAGVEVTDEAGVMERFGEKVVTVPGHPEALKVTTPFDLLVAEAILRARDDDPRRDMP